MDISADLDAYFARIGYSGAREPALANLQRIVAAHVTTIPFENLDVLLGKPINLGIDAVFRKLVLERRGGYCFEQNGLLLHVLGALGFRVAPLSARVRIQRPRDHIPARTHMFVRVDLDDDVWLADVGVGGLSPTAAIRLNCIDEQATLHEPRRILREGGVLYHQVRFGDDWHDVCEFTLEEMPPIDRELANWYTSAHPESHFKNRLIVARAGAGGERLTILNNEFTIRQRDGRTSLQTIDTRELLLQVLDERFGLRFPAATRFGGPGLPWPN